jgi:hypothetical protein
MSVATDEVLRFSAGLGTRAAPVVPSDNHKSPHCANPPPPVRGSIIDACKLLTAEAASVGSVVVGGSIAAMLYMPPRATKDIDVNFFTSTPITTRGEFSRVFGKFKHADISNVQFISSRVPRRHSKLEPELIFGSLKYAGWPLDVYLNITGPVGDRLRQRPTCVGGLAFAPPECVAMWKMMSLPGWERYRRDRADVQALLATVPKDFDSDFVRRCLMEHESGQGRIAEWDGLVAEAFAPRWHC